MVHKLREFKFHSWILKKFNKKAYFQKYSWENLNLYFSHFSCTRLPNSLAPQKKISTLPLLSFSIFWNILLLWGKTCFFFQIHEMKKDLALTFSKSGLPDWILSSNSNDFSLSKSWFANGVKSLSALSALFLTSSLFLIEVTKSLMSKNRSLFDFACCNSKFVNRLMNHSNDV